jgi:hypothetical protein
MVLTLNSIFLSNLANLIKFSLSVKELNQFGIMVEISV